MTAQSATAHLDDDLLSAFLDGELHERQQRKLSDHLADCPSCRADLDGLRRVIRTVGRLERAAPPSVLAQQVQHRVALESRRRGLVERLEGQMEGNPLSSPVMVGFAVVLALALVTYLFSHTVARQQRRAGEATFEIAPAEAARELIAAVDAVTLAGRDFRHRSGVWREVATGDRAPDAVLAAGSAERDELLAREPWIEDLLAGGEPVVLLYRERVVRLEPETEAGAGLRPAPAVAAATPDPAE